MNFPLLFQDLFCIAKGTSDNFIIPVLWIKRREVGRGHHKLQNRGHMDKRAVESAIESWSNQQIAALIVSASRLLQLRLESREASPESEWSTVTSVTPGGKGSASSSTAAGSAEPTVAFGVPGKGKKGLGKGLQRPFVCNFGCLYCEQPCTRNKWNHSNHRCYHHRRM